MEQREQSHLPHIAQKSVSLHSVIDLIHKKKIELSAFPDSTQRSDNPPIIQRSNASKLP